MRYSCFFIDDEQIEIDVCNMFLRIILNNQRHFEQQGS